MNERESEECSCEAQSEWSTLSRGREGCIYRWWEKVTVWGTGWPDVRRTSDVRRPKWVRTSDSHQTTGRCEKCDPQSSVQDTDVRAGPDIRKNASDVKVSDVRRVPDIRKNVSVVEVSDVRKCPDVRAIRKDRTSVEHRTSEGKVATLSKFFTDPSTPS